MVEREKVGIGEREVMGEVNDGGREVIGRRDRKSDTRKGREEIEVIQEREEMEMERGKQCREKIER